MRLTARRAGGGSPRVILGPPRDQPHRVGPRGPARALAAGAYTLSLTVVDSRGKHWRARRAPGSGSTPLTAQARARPVSRAEPGNRFPVAGPALLRRDGFGADRGDHIHQGQDIPAAEGTPLVAPRASTVFATGYSASGSGEYVVLYGSGTNRSYVYFHLHRGSTAVSDGQPVRAGQRIGAVGTTGDSTGPHLHFELWIGRWLDGGHAVDPLPTLRRGTPGRVERAALG